MHCKRQYAELQLFTLRVIAEKRIELLSFKTASRPHNEVDSSGAKMKECKSARTRERHEIQKRGTSLNWLPSNKLQIDPRRVCRQLSRIPTWTRGH